MTLASAGLSEFVSAYVVEAEEHLEAAGAQLLAVDSALRAGNSNLRAVREAFRALHTVKGLSAMVGVEAVVSITHRMEAILRVHDRQATKLPTAAVDALLAALRLVKEMVNAFGEARTLPPPPAALLAALDALDGEHVPVVAHLPTLNLEPHLAQKLGPLELEQLRNGLGEGKRALRVDFVPTAEKAERGISISRVRERVERIGSIVKVFPVATPSAPAAGGLAFVIVFLTDADDAAVAEAASVDAAGIQVVVEIGPRPPALVGDAALEDDILLASTNDAISLPKRGVVRVNVARLDDTVDGLAALLVTRFKLARAVRALRDSGADTRELEQIMADNARQLKTLRSSILRVRMVPVGELLERLPLIVRSLQRTMDRVVQLELDGAEAELDKAVAERLFPALVHLIRNAVDHAIETPDERRRRGKPEAGLLRVECSSRSNRWLELRVIDDGRGIDPIAVARKAGAPVPASSAGLLALICRSGLSTREVATTVSGRGFGMEIVQRIVVEDLGGVLSLESEQSKGTVFKLQVPLSISVVDAFSFVCAGQRFVAPVATVDEIVEVDRAAVLESPNPAGGLPVKLVRHRGRVVPLVSLAGLFALDAAAAETTALVVKRGDDSVAFAIERMLGQQEIVVRPLTDALVKSPGVTGATDLGDGNPTLVLDLCSLGSRASAGELGSVA